MRSTRSATERLAAARPLLADHLDELVSADERAHLLDHIMGSDTTELDPVPARRWSLPQGRIVAAVAGSVAIVLAATTLGVRAWTGGSAGGAKPDSSQRASATLLAAVTTALNNVRYVVVINSTAYDDVRSTFWTLTEGASGYRMSYSIGGKPSYDMALSTANGLTTMTVVDFPAHAWWTVTSQTLQQQDPCFVAIPDTGGQSAIATVATTTQQGASRPDGGTPSCSPFGPTPAQVVQSLNAGEVQTTGHPLLDGRPTIELTAQYPAAHSTLQLFVDASSYLPVKSINSSPGTTVSTDYSYLQASSANLGLLQVPIPPGFRQADQPIRCSPSQLKPHETIFSCP
jgi:hypothetical protein